MQMQVAEIDDQTETLTENENIAVYGIDRQHQAAKDAEVPEGDGTTTRFSFSLDHHWTTKRIMNSPWPPKPMAIQIRLSQS
jgi:hypothetical protein